PRVYADLLGEKISRHNSQVWLVNTGWTGGPFGVGERINLPYTRAMVSAAMNGALQDVPTQPDPVFGLHVPESVPDVPDAVLNPRGTWHDGAAYDDAARKLVARFRENFEQYASDVSEQILAAGP
ncbi:MAG: phosphoenolpyruvate carboxykinase (ATP), partial [Chloroflexi bacterium]|nr:phosphoenolpyruvate carboxykinase (ATP) [Chloroflexota bacterium]